MARARPFNSDDWEAIYDIWVGVPVRKFPFVLKRVGQQLYRLADDVYAVVWPLPYIHDEYPRQTLRVARVFWAKNIQAAKLIGYQHPRVDRKSVHDGTLEPPLVLLRGAAPSWKNGHTYKSARKAKSLMPESAQYNHKGEFKFKVVSLKQLQIYYASRVERESELPIGVEVILRHS